MADKKSVSSEKSDMGKNRPKTSGTQRPEPATSKRGDTMTSDTKTAESKPKTASQPAATGAIPVAPRRVRLVVSRLDPWSVMKMSFLLSVAIGVATVVAVSLLWLVLNGMGVFNAINNLLVSLDANKANNDSLVEAISFGKVVSSATIFSVVNVVLMTAIATLTAVIYNISSSLVGGFLVTLTDD